MQHSHEARDRPSGFASSGLLSPLRHRDFRVLWAGMAVSLVGDGIFVIAVAWETYVLWNAPAALSIVGIGMTVPTVVFLLAGGVLSDRHDRRRLMLWSDLVRAAAVGCLAVLVLTGALRLWELVALVALYGSGTAFFTPAFEAIVPELLPPGDLAAANSLDQFVRPIALRLLGPLLGGWLVAAGTGLAFAADAASFGASAVAVLLMRPAASRLAVHESHGAALSGGLRFIRRRVWLWGTLVTAAAAYLVFLGPSEVLLPYMVKNELHASAASLGFVFAAGGLGAVSAALWMGHRGHPPRDVTVMYATWTLATVAIAGYGIVNAAWQLMLACLVFNAFETAGTIVWATVKQRHVPSAMLGRVSSLDWLISIGLLPVSFALTGPVAGALGARSTLVGAGLVGATITLAGLSLPGMRDVESPGSRRRSRLRVFTARGFSSAGREPGSHPGGRRFESG